LLDMSTGGVGIFSGWSIDMSRPSVPIFPEKQIFREN
jgi:hypothetical protein